MAFSHLVWKWGYNPYKVRVAIIKHPYFFYVLHHPIDGKFEDGGSYQFYSS